MRTQLLSGVFIYIMNVVLTAIIAMQENELQVMHRLELRMLDICQERKLWRDS